MDHSAGNDPGYWTLRVTHFRFSQRNENAFRAPRPVFESPLSPPARPVQRKAQTTDNCAEVSPLSNGDFRPKHSLRAGVPSCAAHSIDSSPEDSPYIVVAGGERMDRRRFLLTGSAVVAAPFVTRGSVFSETGAFLRAGGENVSLAQLPLLFGADYYPDQTPESLWDEMPGRWRRWVSRMCASPNSHGR